MLLVGRKYNVDFIPHSMSRDTLSRMPIWHHKGFRDNTHPMNNGKWQKCLRANHNIHTVGDVLDYTSNIWPPQHSNRVNCRCTTCQER